MNKITIIITDDQILYSDGVAETLCSQSDFEIIECDCRYPLETIEKTLPDVEDMTLKGNGLRNFMAPLTVREKQILQYVAEGKSNRKIAGMLEIKEQTVKSHVSAILQKMHAKHRAQAVALALRKGWIRG